jgi:DNA (cytosine-5)-methyltransferase 1
VTPHFLRVPAYPADLERAWHEACAPREEDAPTVISTFAGRGGSSTGYHMAGYRELLAVEWDAHAADTLRLNYPGLDVYHGDIAALSVDEALERTGLKAGELDLLDGSPPCQGFSTTGTRQLDDPRNQLFREYVRLLAGLQPRAFVMENVAGMNQGPMRQIYREAIDALRDAGYVTVSGVVDAAGYGVPQHRKRLIVIGARQDLGLTPTLPPPTVSRPVPIREALHGLPDTPDGYRLPEGPWHTVWARTPVGRSFKDLHPKGHLFNNRKVDPERPAHTIVKTVGITRAGTGASGYYHWRHPRLLTVPELKRLGSFPDAYRFASDGDPHHDFTNTWAGIGNSVPPLMARAIGQHVRQTLLKD